jgi:hypothetical protein
MTRAAEIPEPLSFISRTRFAVPHRRVTAIVVGLGMAHGIVDCFDCVRSNVCFGPVFTLLEMYHPSEIYSSCISCCPATNSECFERCCTAIQVTNAYCPMSDKEPALIGSRSRPERSKAPRFLIAGAQGPEATKSRSSTTTRTIPKFRDLG